MQIGAIFPQTEIGSDPGAIREYAQAAEELGYSHLFIADHVLGASSDHHSHVAGGYYTHQAVIHESFTTMGYLAAITQRIGLTTAYSSCPSGHGPGGQAGCGSGRAQQRAPAPGASAWAGITWNTRPSTATSATGAAVARSRLP